MRQSLLLLAMAIVPTIAAVAAGPDGAAVYDKWCAPCHAPGISHPGTQALKAKYVGDWQGVLRDWKELTPDYIRLTVRQGISVMPHFRKTEISDAELDALARYIARKP
jgi:mono/diheme cytochrome c family protein